MRNRSGTWGLFALTLPHPSGETKQTNKFKKKLA